MTFDRLDTWLTRFAAGVAILGGIGLLAATALTCVSIIFRLLGRAVDTVLGPEALPWLAPILGEEEIVKLSVGFALFAALPWVMIQKGHIRVDLFEPLFGSRLNRVLDLLGDIALAAIAWLIMTRQWYQIFDKPRGDDPLLGQLLLQRDWPELVDRTRTRQDTQILEIPLWPTYMVAEVCVIIFFVIAAFCVIRSARALFL